MCSSGWYDSGYDSYGGSSYSSISDSRMGARSLSNDLYPLNKKIKATTKHPIIIFLDVTGSNTSFAKIVYDKMPMFFGQIEQKGYLKDFEISVCAVGDAYTDDYPLQIADFAKGTDIDTWLEQLVLEGAGGGQCCETYELAAYYALHNFEFNDKDCKPIIFFIGDEAPYDTVSRSLIKRYVDEDTHEESDVQTKDVFKELLKKIPNTFMFLNPYQGYYVRDDIVKTWRGAFETKSHNLITMQRDNEKAIVDLMLGVIAMVGETDLDTYKVDMLDRGQTRARIESVNSTLLDLSKALVPTKVVTEIQRSGNTITRKSNKNTRL